MERNIRRTAVIMTNDSTGDYSNRNKNARKQARYRKQDRSKEHKNISLNPFVSNVPFLYPLKTENLTVF